MSEFGLFPQELIDAYFAELDQEEELEASKGAEMTKRNWFPTLNEALASENLVSFWPLGSNINYGQTVSHVVYTGELKGKRQVPVMRLISVYRDETGKYERPVTYITN